LARTNVVVTPSVKAAITAGRNGISDSRRTPITPNMDLRTLRKCGWLWQSGAV
jgi:hypothetical protein